MEGTKINARVKYILFTGVVLVTTLLSIWLMVRYWHEIGELQKWGLVGIFVIAFIAGVSIPLPISYLLVVFAMAHQPTYGVWQPALVGLCGGVGAGLGGTLLFLLGRGGRHIFPGLQHIRDEEETQKKRFFSRFNDKFTKWAHKRGSIVVFVMSAMLNPVFAPMAIAMGAIRYKAFKFFIMCTAGNLLKALTISYLGFLGLGFIQRVFGS